MSSVSIESTNCGWKIFWKKIPVLKTHSFLVIIFEEIRHNNYLHRIYIEFIIQFTNYIEFTIEMYSCKLYFHCKFYVKV